MCSTPISVLLAEANEPLLALRRSYMSDRSFLTNFTWRNNPLIQKVQLVAKKRNEDAERLRRGRKRRKFRFRHDKSALVSSFNSIRGVLKSCKKSLGPAYSDENWEELLHRVEIDCVLADLINACTDPQETFDKLISTSYQNSVRIFTDGSVFGFGFRLMSVLMTMSMLIDSLRLRSL